MTIEINPLTNTGGWLASFSDKDKATVYAHADIGTTGDDPVTIFWGGRTSTPQARDFFQASVSVGSKIEETPPYFRTVLIVSDKESVFDDVHKLTIPTPDIDLSAIQL